MVKEKLGEVKVRSNIGVRNPYPLAEAILLKKGVIKEPIVWTKLSPEAAKSYLYKAFHLSYDKLFDPINKSPLYRGMPGLEGKNLSLLSRRDYLFTRKTGGNPCTDYCIPSDWVELDTWKYPPAPPPATQSSCGNGPFGTDIMQGCVGDCYLIASLSAVAWTKPSRLTGKRPSTPAPPPNLHRYSFMDPVTGKVNSKNLERPLPVDQNKNLIYAKPMNGSCVWPSMYEKAYAVIQRLQDPAKPDICVLDFGNAATALSEIARMPVGATFVGEPNWFDAISGRCGDTGVATSPMVTWTYESETMTPGGGTYTDDLISANHSYTILGTGIVDGLQCIVLRNPFGLSFAGPVKDGIAEWDWVTWTPSSRLSPPPPGDPPVSPSDGVFAMELDAFAGYFEGFCYTT